MVKARVHENQLPLYEIPSHDYGGVSNGNRGHEYPFVAASATQSNTDEEFPGVSVSLKERARAIDKAANVYALYARARGLGKAALIPMERAKLDARYENVDDLVANAKAKRFYTTESTFEHPSDEQRMLEPLLMTRQLEEVGFSRVDIEEATQQTILEVRQSIGTDVGHSVRQKNVKVAKKSAN